MAKEKRNVRNEVVVIGSSRLGANIATKLSKNGESVIIIDKSEDSFLKLAESFSGYQLLGDATDLDFLYANRINEAKEIIVCTNNDNINLFLSHICYFIFKIEKIFVRLSDYQKSRLLENTPIKGIYPFFLSIEEFEKLRGEIV